MPRALTPPSGRQRKAIAKPSPADRGRWNASLTIGLAAFALSITIALVNVYYFLRGSALAALPPEEISIYLVGTEEKARIFFGVRTSLINAATGSYGEVLLDSELRPGLDAPAFRQEAMISAPMAYDETACKAPVSCVRFGDSMVIEHEQEVIEVPAGAARAFYLSYPLTATRCTEQGDHWISPCDAYGGPFRQAARMIFARPLTIRIRLQSFGDGERVIDCDLPGISRKQWDFLVGYRYATLTCLRTRVSSSQWF